MFSHLFGLLLYSLGMSFAILLPAVLIALQEICIEGPFGWSSLTFTKRYPTTSLISKIYRGISGQDKWATKYHLVSNAIWLLMYLIGFIYVAYYSKVASVFNRGAWAATAVLAFVSFLELALVEDYIWFLLHPYFGPDRHTSQYVPWFQTYKEGVPISYWFGMAATVVVAIVSSVVLRQLDILIIWLITLALVSLFTFRVLRNWSKKIQRMPLKKSWWKSARIVAIRRCPYVRENKDPHLQVESYVIPEEIMTKLIQEGSVIPLEDALSGKSKKK